MVTNYSLGTKYVYCSSSYHHYYRIIFVVDDNIRGSHSLYIQRKTYLINRATGLPRTLHRWVPILNLSNSQLTYLDINL